MGKKCNQYTSEDISRFIDNELSPGLYHTLANHMDHCPDCKNLAEAYTRVSADFRDHTHKAISCIDPVEQQQKLKAAIQQIENNAINNRFGLFGKNIYLKLASIAAIVMFSLYAFQEDHSSGPSAIVKSVNTDFASVMIIETQKEQHTIIWFSET